MKLSEQLLKTEVVVPFVVSIVLRAGGICMIIILGETMGGGMSVGAGALGLCVTLYEAFKKWYRERSRAIGTQRERVLASHSTGFHLIDITDEAVQMRNLKIPFNSITECAFRRWSNRIKTACIIKYVD